MRFTVHERSGRAMFPWCVSKGDDVVAAFTQELPARKFAKWRNGELPEPAKPDRIKGPTGACPICGSPIYSKLVEGVGEPVVVRSCEWPHSDLKGSPFYEPPA